MLSISYKPSITAESLHYYIMKSDVQLSTVPGAAKFSVQKSLGGHVKISINSSHLKKVVKCCLAIKCR